eukprot:CAMPEP_0184020436 /NCGR_PEP_ID=MMETSP0954-20121128/9348_1 /TAXON_ID=627963 /ORGANISM="Aplanochytrium sp, Strain PBS07" /LENGTH=207 /DNA_ID=CAMNT_0026302297 /DNA_START=403 /DNA_END=1026 /DNA_ORIENTATION=-
MISIFDRTSIMGREGGVMLSELSDPCIVSTDNGTSTLQIALVDSPSTTQWLIQTNLSWEGANLMIAESNSGSLGDCSGTQNQIIYGLRINDIVELSVPDGVKPSFKIVSAGGFGQEVTGQMFSKDISMIETCPTPTLSPTPLPSMVTTDSPTVQSESPTASPAAESDPNIAGLGSNNENESRNRGLYISGLVILSIGYVIFLVSNCR